ncbi:MAG: pantetheine-phosphate adenylyltransferase [Clostridia bacterium]|nr:pantetheine-phosphate adenylyltransferase [Clostridia bacterium]
MRRAVCPGSYDPITVGHEDIVRRARALFGRVEVVVMNNREKEYLFSLEERYAMACAAFEGEEGIEVYSSEGMLYDYLRGKDAVLVKGVRDEKDFLYERNCAVFNFEHSGVETLYLDSSAALRTLSSTVVRDKIEKKESLKGLVSEKVVKLLRNKL